MRQGALAVACLVCLSTLEADTALPLRLRLTTASDFPSAARSALVREASSIWQRAGIRLEWETPSSAVPSGLRILVVHRPPPSVGSESAWPVGELVLARQPVSSGPAPTIPIAFVSIEAGRQILDSAGLTMEPERMTQQRLGVVLGRAVAHEIGHYLLATPTHAASGLMRARIAAADFADLREGGFFLDRRASHWLRLGASPIDRLEQASMGFHYSPR